MRKDQNYIIEECNLGPGNFDLENIRKGFEDLTTKFLGHTRDLTLCFLDDVLMLALTRIALCIIQKITRFASSIYLLYYFFFRIFPTNLI